MGRIERYNSLTAIVGVILSLAGLVVLVVLASKQGNPWKIVSFSIYASSLLLMYIFSSLYHSLSGKIKTLFGHFDHLSIYLLIAGTYTPLALVVLEGAWGWSIFGVVWGLAVAGILYESLAPAGKRIIPVVIYLVMGWSIMAALSPLMLKLSTEGFYWLFTGGLFYSLGIIFYALGDRIPIMHVVWHLFVLAGSICHFILIYNLL